MACSKYTLRNTGSTIVHFSYRRCDDSYFDNQVELLPNQLKNIWLIDETYNISSYFQSYISLIDEGSFPPMSATNTPTPTPSVTIGMTPTPTETPTNTPTNTPSSTPSTQIIINAIIVGENEYLEVGNDEYLMFVDPIPPTPTPTPTNTA